jgi:hypothetical protein
MQIPSIFSLGRVLLLAAIVFATTRVHADTTYTYTGQPYNPNPPTFCNGTYVPVCSSIGVSGSITLASPLGDNLVENFVTPTSFSFSGGTDAFLLTQASTLPLANFQFSTDASGNITAWAIELATDSGPNSGCGTSTLPMGGSFACIGIENANGSIGDYSAFDQNFELPNEVYGSGQNRVAGTWTTAIATTPEPVSIVLLGTGGVIAIVRKRILKR